MEEGEDQAEKNWLDGLCTGRNAGKELRRRMQLIDNIRHSDLSSEIERVSGRKRRKIRMWILNSF